MKSRLCIWMRDTPRFHRGDVVDVLREGQHAGKLVEDHADWRIMEVDGPPEQHQWLLEPHFHEDGRLGLHRLHKIEVDLPGRPIASKLTPPHPKVIR